MKITKSEHILLSARIALLQREPFWGTLATRLIIKDMTDTDMFKGHPPTVATDGRHFFYHRDFVEKLTKETAMWCFAHEVEHCIYDHFERRGSRQPDIWNAAADYVINWEITEARIGTKPDKASVGFDVCYDPKYAGMYAEEVYDLLIKDPTLKHLQFDLHMAEDPKYPMTPEERAATRAEFKSAVRQAASLAGGREKLPGGVRDLLREMDDPVVDWRTVLAATMKSTVKDDYSWQRQSRKSMHSGIYLPGHSTALRISAALAIDTSGSMGDDMLRDLLTETYGLMAQFTDFELHVWCFDTSVHGYTVFTPNNVNDIVDYEIIGGGGTSFDCNWRFMRDNNIRPERFIMMTDGGTGDGWGEDSYVPTIFLIHSDPRRTITAPHGQTLYYQPA